MSDEIWGVCYKSRPPAAVCGRCTCCCVLLCLHGQTKWEAVKRGLQLCVVPNDFCQESESLISASSLWVHASCSCVWVCVFGVLEANYLDSSSSMPGYYCVSVHVFDCALCRWMNRRDRGVSLAVSGLRQSATTSKRVANIACLAFSEGNRPIDFWLCSLFYLHRRASSAQGREMHRGSLKRNWLVDGGEDRTGRMLTRLREDS